MGGAGQAAMGFAGPPGVAAMGLAGPPGATAMEGALAAYRMCKHQAATTNVHVYRWFVRAVSCAEGWGCCGHPVGGRVESEVLHRMCGLCISARSVVVTAVTVVRE